MFFPVYNPPSPYCPFIVHSLVKTSKDWSELELFTLYTETFYQDFLNKLIVGLAL